MSNQKDTPAPQPVQGEAIGNLCIYPIWDGKAAQVQNLRFDHLPLGDYPIYTQPPAPAVVDARLYEELREAIDNGHESMTHLDALAWVEESHSMRETKPTPAVQIAAPGDVERHCNVLIGMIDSRCYTVEGVAAMKAGAAALRSQSQPVAAPNEGDMARALEWVRAVANYGASENGKRFLPIIEEAIAAYDPERMAKCGNTVAAPGDVVMGADRAVELATRLVAPGPKAAHVSASETHELSEWVMTAAAALRSQGQADAVVTDAMVTRFMEAATEQGFIPVRGTTVERVVRSLLTVALAQQANQDKT